MRAHPRGGQGDRRRRQHRQAPHQADAGQPCRAGSSTRTCRCPSRRWRIVCPSATARPASAYRRGRRREGPRLPQVRGGRCDRHRQPARPRLKERYVAELRAALQGRARPRQHHGGPAPREDRRQHGRRQGHPAASLIEGALRDLEVITGQKPVVTRAKKSIAGFKLREGKPIGVKVTLRGDRAWEFLDRLISLAIPRVRDFRGLSPEVVRRPRQLHLRGHRAADLPRDRLRPIDTTRGMDITIVTTARTDDEGRAFLAAFGFPFRQETR